MNWQLAIACAAFVSGFPGLTQTPTFRGVSPAEPSEADPYEGDQMGKFSEPGKAPGFVS